MAVRQRGPMRLTKSTSDTLVEGKVDSMHTFPQASTSKLRSYIQDLAQSSPSDDHNIYSDSDTSPSCSSSEIGPPSIHKDRKTTRDTTMAYPSFLQSYCEPTKDVMHRQDDHLSRVTGSDYQDFQMSVSYESIEGWTTTTSGSSTRTGSVPLRRLQKRRSTVGWEADGINTASTANGPDRVGMSVTRTRSGRIVKPVMRSESMPSLKKRRAMSDAAYRESRRATTPPAASNLSKSGPDRPQSAMKHKSANRYSQGKDESIILDTSLDSMPQTSPERSPFLHAIPLSSHSTTATTTLKSAMARGDDPDAFSPAQSNSRHRPPLFFLRSRASLPRYDFYERHKREEGSPTPEARRLAS